MKPRRSIRHRSYEKRKPYGTYKTVRVMKKKKKDKKRNYGVYIIGFTIIFLLVLLFGMTFFVGDKTTVAFESDMTIRGVLGQGESTPNFKVNKNHRIIVKISDYSSSSGNSMVVELWGAGSDWYRICEGDNSYSIIIDESNMYNIHFSVNRNYGRGQVSFHVRIEVE